MGVPQRDTMRRVSGDAAQQRRAFLFQHAADSQCLINLAGLCLEWLECFSFSY